MAETSQAPIRPSTLQVDRFTASTSILNNLAMHHRPIAEWTFRFCFGAKTLVPRPCERCSSALVGGVSSNTSERSERSKAVCQLTNPDKRREIVQNKSFGTTPIHKPGKVMSHAFSANSQDPHVISGVVATVSHVLHLLNQILKQQNRCRVHFIRVL